MRRRNNNNKARRRGRKNNVASNGNGYSVGRYGSVAPMRSLNSTFRGGFPDRARVKLVYPDTIAVTGSVTPGTYVYRGNGVFDPDFTGTGLQPPFFDEWALAYNFYRVWGCKITVSLTAPSATTFGRFIVAARRVATAPTNSPALLGMAAQEYCISGMVGPNGITGVDGSRQALGASVSMNISTPRFKAQTTSGFLGSEDLASSVTTTPADPWYFLISVINLDSSTSTTYRGMVTLEYDVEFFGRYEDSLDLLAARAIQLSERARTRTVLSNEHKLRVATLSDAKGTLTRPSVAESDGSRPISADALQRLDRPPMIKVGPDHCVDSTTGHASSDDAKGTITGWWSR